MSSARFSSLPLTISCEEWLENTYDLAEWTAIVKNRRIHDWPGRAGRTLHSRGAV